MTRTPEVTSTSFCNAAISALHRAATESPSGTGLCSFRWSCEAWSSGMRAMRLTSRRKARRRGQLIAVGALSQSCPSVGWTGRVACGYIGQRNSTT